MLMPVLILCPNSCNAIINLAVQYWMPYLAHCHQTLALGLKCVLEGLECVEIAVLLLAGSAGAASSQTPITHLTVSVSRLPVLFVSPFPTSGFHDDGCIADLPKPQLLYDARFCAMGAPKNVLACD